MPSAGQALDAALRRYAVSREAVPALEALLEHLALPKAPTSVHDPLQAVDVHIADSLAALEVPEVRAAGLIVDVGSGAGLPGLVLSAVFPDVRVVLIEAARRKCEFLRSARRAMGAQNAEVAWARVEEWTEGLGRCDVVCARALATLPVVCEYAAPLLREGGVLIAWKGAVSESEAADGSAAAGHLGLLPQPVHPVVPFPGSERRSLHVFRKVRPTPPRYPRRPGAATKRPLSAGNLR
jgi:16S rRNA (guanine527-N7)-methyltransferase